MRTIYSLLIAVALVIAVVLSYPASAGLVSGDTPNPTTAATAAVAVSTTGWVKTGTNIHQAVLSDKVGVGTASLTSTSTLTNEGNASFRGDVEISGAIKLVDGAITTAPLGTDSVTTAKVINLAISTDKLAVGAVTTVKLGNDAVITIKILDLNVTEAKLAAGAVTTSKLSADAVTTAKVINLAITADKIAVGAVTTAKLGTDSVITIKILDLNITTAKLAESAVTTSKLSADAVTTAKIINGAITAAKANFNYAGSSSKGGPATTALALDTDPTTCTNEFVRDFAADGTLDCDGVAAADIDTGAVSTAKLGADAVTTVKILNGNVTEAKLAAGAVTTAKLADGAVTTSKLHAEALDPAGDLDLQASGGETVFGGDLRLSGGSIILNLNGSPTISNPFGGAKINFRNNGRLELNVGANTFTEINSTYSSGSADQVPFRIAPTVNQSGTAGFIGIEIDPTITTQGSGVQYLIRAAADDADIFVVEIGGNVGVGSDEPATLLEVEGDFQAGSGVTKSTITTTGRWSQNLEADCSPGGATPDYIGQWCQQDSGTSPVWIATATTNFASIRLASEGTVPSGELTISSDAAASTAVSANAWTLMDDGACIPGVLVEFTESANCVLRYDGSETKFFRIVASLSTTKGAGSATTFFYRVAINGNAETTESFKHQQIRDNAGTDTGHITVGGKFELSTNDTVGIHVSDDTGDDLTLNAFTLFIDGI